ncbi:hypothetical protein TVNIR_2116 [Thioalkalivibrio nitratireducens DSM 14787]|uniref:Uncharacterized protein n=1 Tax=Thioalkalivibrio nitratireducens (strain DSM 14787 / UNIQEM 213 / ALEN2) TaxID=1255043 RepID=L0DXS6_THIND|nr:hypothetical protein TVNIR_2116 [Thioalkalivibrio nitratireducens DSM 14787]
MGFRSGQTKVTRRHVPHPRLQPQSSQAAGGWYTRGNQDRVVHTAQGRQFRQPCPERLTVGNRLSTVQHQRTGSQSFEHAGDTLSWRYVGVGARRGRCWSLGHHRHGHLQILFQALQVPVGTSQAQPDLPAAAGVQQRAGQGRLAGSGRTFEPQRTASGELLQPGFAAGLHPVASAGRRSGPCCDG